MRKYGLFILLICVSISASFSKAIDNHPAVTVTANTEILIDKSEDAPVKRALQDLVRDMKSIFGTEPKVISTLAEADKNSALIIVTCKGIITQSFRDQSITDFESHLVTTGTFAGRKAIVLQGADMRGTIYAIYTFSEKVLGIPPLWIWTSYKPQPQSQIVIQASTRLYYPAPVVKWRAWFPNDRDLLDPWQSKNANNYDAMFETMLRLKINTREGYLVDGGTWITPYKASKEACYARDRGFKISFTHTAPFGAVLKNWDNYWSKIRKLPVPPLQIKNVQGLIEFWKYHIETIQKEKLDVIWQIGFRGMGDKPFWRNTYEDAKDEPKEDKDRAAIISSMLTEQVALLKKTIGEEHPLMKITIYNENSDFLAAGLLRLPDEPKLILNYSSARGDHYPPAEIQNFNMPGNQPIGYYMNFQFTGTGAHLAPAEGPWKMEQSFRYVVAKTKRPMFFSVVNAGNVREHVLELSANAAMMWSFDTFKTNDFLKTYCTQYYGTKDAITIAALYTDYYNAYWLPKKADIPGFDRQYVFQDLRYAKAIEQICTLWDRPYLADPFNDRNKGVGGAMATGGRQYSIAPEPNQIEAALNGTQNSMAKFKVVAAKADAIYQSLSGSPKLFFNDDLRLQAQFMAQVNQALNNIVQAYKDKHDGKTADSKSHVEAALKSVIALKTIKAQADHDRFSDWYQKDKNFDMAGLEQNINDVLKKFN
jgi:hypothetical protein